MKPLLLLIFTCLIISCADQTPDLSTSQKGTMGTINFNYPANWEITGREEADDFNSLFLDTSSGGIMIIKSYPLEEAGSLKELAEEFSKCASGEVPFGTMKTDSLKEERIQGESVVNELFYMKLLGQEIEFQRLYKSKDLSGRRLFFILQETTDVYPEALKGFEFITKSVTSR